MSSFSSAALGQKHHACPRGRGISFDFGQGIAALDVRKVGGEYQKVDAGVLSKLESFSLGGRHGHVIAGGTHRFLEQAARGGVGIDNQNALALRGQIRTLRVLNIPSYLPSVSSSLPRCFRTLHANNGTSF